jgi:hypothetical protein
MVTKTTDSKGRITLGERFANRTVIVQDIDETEVRVTLARVIPEREAWLQENPKAKASVLKGLAQAKGKRFAKNPPDLLAAAKLAARLQDDEA